MIALETHKASKLWVTFPQVGQKIKSGATDGLWRHHADHTLLKYNNGSPQQPMEPALPLPS